MKILHTESSLGWGGQELRVVSEAEGCARKGHDVAIACAQGAAFGDRADLANVRLFTRNISKKRILCLISMYRLIVDYRPDIVVTHSSTDSWLVTVALQFINKKPKLVRCRHVSAPIKQNRTTKWLYSQPDLIVTTSNDIKNNIISHMGVDPSKVFSVPTGIDPSVVENDADKDSLRQRFGIESDRFVILMAATLRSWKGHSDVLNALTELDDHDFFLMILGDGPQLKNLREQVVNAGLQDRVRFYGYSSHISDFFRVADCFCQPSTKNEGVSQSVLQAFFAKLPVVATAVSGLNEVVNEQTAMVVEPSNPKSIKSALIRLKGRDAKTTELVVNGYALVSDRFSYECMINTMVDLYAELIG